MSSIPSNLGRVPNLLSSGLLLSSITKTNIGLLNVQTQIASGKRISRFSEDALAGSTISVLQDRLERGTQRLQNLSSAEGTLNFLDSTLTDANSMLLEAISIASDQINTSNDSTTRANQAVVIDGMIRSLYQLANRSTNGVYVFGGSTATSQPIQELRGGFRYVARGSGFLTDLGAGEDIPITLGGNNSIGETSARLRGTADLNPALTLNTRLIDVAGGRGLGISEGTVALSINGGPDLTIDLANVDTVGDVVNRISAAITQYETDNSITVLDTGGVSVGGGAGGSLSFDLVAGATLEFSDIGQGVVAQDLGLSGLTFDELTTTAGADLNPRLTLLSPISSLSGVTMPLGSLRLRFTQGPNTSYVDIDLSGAQTIADLRSHIQTQAPGVRVEINAAGTGIDLFNEVSGVNLTVEEVAGGANTAQELGIRSLNLETTASEFNNGRGIRIVDGKLNPETNLIDREFNRDFRITLGNGQVFDVDLRPQDMVDVQSILNRINQEFADAVAAPPINGSAPALVAGDFTATLTDGPNGIAFVQGATVGGGAISVQKLNNSAAAEDLGFTDGTWDALSATFVAQDTAGVRVNNLFSTLIDLRDALRANDTSGITIAGEELERAKDRLSEARALVGVYAGRVDRATNRQEDLMVVDEKMRSEVQDLDYADASIRFSQLQTQLQAALAAGAQVQSLNLLDFLG